MPAEKSLGSNFTIRRPRKRDLRQGCSMDKALAAFTTDPMALTVFALGIVMTLWFAYSLRRKPGA